MIIQCVFIALCLGLAHSQFPRACTTTAALRARTCCPAWNDGSPCGSSSGRGECRDRVVFTPLAAGVVRQFEDDRLDWPRKYFDQTCECFGNYSGFNCGECKYGYYGDKCDRQKVKVRKEIRELSFLERKRFFSYLALVKTTKSRNFVVLSTGDRHHQDTYRFVDASIYDVFAWIHYYSMKPILDNGTFDGSKNYAHEGPAFPGWHRMGLLFIEREIQLLTGDEDFAIPYYDWRGEQNCSICVRDFMGENDVHGNLEKYSYFASWKAICSGYSYDDAYCHHADDPCQMETLQRKPGVDPRVKSFPSFQDVNDTLKWEDFDNPPYNSTARRSFRNALEGFLRPSDGITLERNMHNLVHVYLGGTISQVAISANDPIFLLHHGYIDKIFEAWVNKYNATSDTYPDNEQPGQGPEECITPYFPCYRNKDLLSSARNFGYTYTEYQGM